MKYSLQVDNLCKSYKNTDFKLKDVTITIPKGTIMGFVGKNGAGKSTTINAILNIIHKDSGNVRFFGQEMTDGNKIIRNDVGVVFDSSNFYAELTPVKLGKVFSDVYSNWEQGLFEGLLKRFNIPNNKKVKTFSRGMSMKLSIAAALSHRAKLLILDEATAGLDPVIREEILDVFLEFVEDENNSVLISSHISSDLEKIADFITFINNGKIILTEAKHTLIYEYGVVRCKQSDFDKFDRSEYISYRKRGLQLEVLISNKAKFVKRHPHVMIDNATIDEILPLITQEDNSYEGIA